MVMRSMESGKEVKVTIISANNRQSVIVGPYAENGPFVNIGGLLLDRRNILEIEYV